MSTTSPNGDPQMSVRSQTRDVVRSVVLAVLAGLFVGSCVVADFYGDPAPGYLDRTAYRVLGSGQLQVMTFACAPGQELTRIDVVGSDSGTSALYWSAAGEISIGGRTTIEFGREPAGMHRLFLSELGPDEFRVRLSPAGRYAISRPMRLEELPDESSGEVVTATGARIPAGEFWKAAEASCGR